RVDSEHIKVRATAEAVSARLRENPERNPVLVFAERRATLEELRARIASAGSTAVEIIDGNTPANIRGNRVRDFQASKVHALLVSKVAEMGLDIDGPEDKDSIWLIHHDFPWNPALVEQRNGRVARPAKGTPKGSVWIFYPFIRDTVDERIFKRMLMRQALAEVLLGTDDVARSLRIADHESLDGIDIAQLDSQLLREVTPSLSPDAAAAAPVSAKPEESTEHVRAARPRWCPLELHELVSARVEAVEDSEIGERVVEIFAAMPHWCDRGVHYLQVDLQGRKQAVAVFQGGELIESLSLAAVAFEPERALAALEANCDPGVAGLALVPLPEGTLALVARAGNLARTMSDMELHRLVVDTAERADSWERSTSEEDRW
ncbi:MAG: hypothetical protein HC927_12760, partial [Deltaproteobacteria bacterium]|nr:hypothetical protein [Deltaproteobacteria bacterium]